MLWPCDREYHYILDHVASSTILVKYCICTSAEHTAIDCIGEMSSRKEGNPHSVSSLLTSTPRSKAKKSRKRRLHTYSLVEPTEGAAAVVSADADTATGKDDSTGTGSCVQNCVLSEFMKIADTIPDIKYRLFDPSGAYAGTLEVTPTTCNVTPLGPMDVVRLVVSSTTGLCQYQVMYPVPRCVERLKCEFTCMI